MDNIVKKEQSFSYKYSAIENKEIQEIRKKYLPKQESKLEELKRLDAQVQNSGMVESLCTGIIGCLVFVLGLCLVMQVLGSSKIIMILGVLLSIVGIIGMILAYPVYRVKQKKEKENLSPRILELTEDRY